MANQQPQASQKLAPVILLGITIAAAASGAPSFIQQHLDRNQYASAMQSYEQANCRQAVAEFNKVIEAIRITDTGDYVSRAQQKKAECDFYLNGNLKASQGKHESALKSYFKLALYDKSALHSYTQDKIKNLLNQTDSKTLASGAVCSNLQIAAEGNLLPKSNLKLAQLYHECGGVLEAKQQNGKAVKIYQDLLQNYPQYSLASDVKRSLARATVADYQAQGSQTLAEPSQTGLAPEGSAILEIQNTAPARLGMTASGPTPKFEQLSTCRDCKTYINKAPKTCPGKGPIGRYKLAPGNYDIAVKLMADNGNQVRPWTGKWNLRSGASYGMCFFLVDEPTEQAKETKDKRLTLP